MPREHKAYCEDVLECIRKIETYTKDLSFENFTLNELIQDAVVRNLEIIGEAVKKLPDELKIIRPEIQWRNIAGLRDIIAHDYFGLDYEIVWDVVKNKLPELGSAVAEVKEKV